MLSLIVARGRDGAIGRDGDIPWSIPADLKFFQRETLGGAVIMGRRTWESLPVRPLPRRMNIMVSRDPSLTEHVCGTVEAALEMARAGGHARIYGMGGERIYAALLPLADRLLVTEVDITVTGADAHFPAFEEADWRELGRLKLESDGPGAVVRELVRAAAG
ncbi:MAG: dihydrofolate reductase [Alterinioella nitratireducens]|uniref:dihydrofolate reductase n=2 Tax=Alterinioella nitratireducens TaxID=2735915 RepID=UPI00405A07CA